jgi:hypothetical protein
MKISNDTIKILQNFATINPNVVLSPGKQVKTISEAKNIFASAQIAEEFNNELGIYDLSEFLSVLSLIEAPSLEHENKVIHIKSESNKAGIKYACANPEILTTPNKDIKDPEYDVSFDLKHSVIKSIQRAASILKYDNFSFKSEAGSEDILVTVSDPKNSSSNVYSEVVGTTGTEDEFEFTFVIANLKLIPGDYRVNLSARLISKWEAVDVPVTYWIAIETY